MLVFYPCTVFLQLVLAPTGASKPRKDSPSVSPESKNVLIVTMMSFDRAGIIKHNHHVQTRHARLSGSFPAHLSQTLPGQAFLCFVCAKR